MKSDLVEITGFQHHETEKAILFSDTGDADDAVWLPKSQIEVNRDVHKTHFITVTMPEWLAQDKGLI